MDWGRYGSFNFILHFRSSEDTLLESEGAMTVASLELCKTLYELSGWEATQNFWKSLLGHDAKTWRDFKVVDFNGAEIPDAFGERTYPAYDLGYLLRKLQPLSEERGRFFLSFNPDQDRWFTGFSATYDQYHSDKGDADTPEDAACKLAIELFKQGVLKHG
jgi:hypothetical protein